ncbi:hypothetical protein [Paraburkholderia tropica]|uniref:hypothetical protein n=1 Tax=Paraburkholderia tropica TaxID=92647 RepID=UPI001F2DF5E1|nr:hypothetical protein [Paraburkholderia tropica]
MSATADHRKIPNTGTSIFGQRLGTLACGHKTSNTLAPKASTSLGEDEMQHQQFERDVAHLELTEEQYLIPSGALRVTRLPGLLDDIECATKRLESTSPLGATPLQVLPASSRSRL